MCLVVPVRHADGKVMEQVQPIYLQFCGDCGRPALTFDEQGIPRCVEHASVFIPADGAARDQRANEEAG